MAERSFLMRRRLIILGTAGLAREVAMVVDCVNDQEQRWEFCGFVGESTDRTGDNLGIGPVLGNDEWLLSQSFDADLVIGIGRPKIRAQVISRYLERKDQFQYPNIIHPKATYDVRYVTMGRGNVVTAGCIFTCDIVVKDFNYFNLNATIGHDVRIGSFNVINPGANLSGGVLIADSVLVGTGSQLLEDVSIGSNAVVGAGAVVLSDVSAGKTVIGVPAKPIETDNG
jgi:sugar O-acyltransferase (sialic acid O-acetyltransferase NeuD family)